MLLSDPTTKKAASAKAETSRQENFDICPSFSDEGAAVDLRRLLRRCTSVMVATTDGRPRRIHSKEMRISRSGPKVASHR